MSMNRSEDVVIALLVYYLTRISLLLACLLFDFGAIPQMSTRRTMIVTNGYDGRALFTTVDNTYGVMTVELC